MKRRLLPQRFALPSAREALGGDVDGRVSGEQGIDLSLHVVVGRNDVEEILDDAKAEIDFPLVDRNGNPRAAHAPLGQQSQMPVKTIHIQSLIEGGSRLEHMILLRYG